MNKAKDLLTNGVTLAICSGQVAYTSTKRGVAPLLEIIDNQTDVRGFDCADRVVGKGAAFLYVLLNVARVHACVISKVALEVLRDCDIEVTYDTLAERIENRTKTGYCPIEEAVLDITAPNEALIAIKNKLKELTK